ncbi:predicted protein [Plenodomus lingam JN3]|uniref:Predicted protein n=1 Tax=Leptosphaeria maculans (strain JN3 / isolate v23.1.3 / race Av1-4-5-6-7-8) TaxID=985895 RepID=E5A574_LEPMJ|nr:predicted protein [Plenodomus lingam JN3]CBX98772.1 predicted protein [Plenodomus lingam JN3]
MVETARRTTCPTNEVTKKISDKLDTYPTAKLKPAKKQIRTIISR